MYKLFTIVLLNLILIIPNIYCNNSYYDNVNSVIDKDDAIIKVQNNDASFNNIQGIIIDSNTEETNNIDNILHTLNEKDITQDNGDNIGGYKFATIVLVNKLNYSHNILDIKQFDIATIDDTTIRFISCVKDGVNFKARFNIVHKDIDIPNFDGYLYYPNISQSIYKNKFIMVNLKNCHD